MVVALLLLAPLVMGYDECKRVTPPGDIPCRVTTTWVPPSACNTYFAIIFNSSGDNVSTLGLSALGSSGFCMFNFTITTAGDYPYNISTGDTGNILVQGDDEMASLSVTLFILLINVAIFALPLFVRFTKNDILNNIMAKMVYIAGLTFLAFNTTIIVTLAARAGLGVTQELFRYQFIFLWGIWIALIFLFFNMVVSSVQMWRVQKTKKRMGEE